jgi:hypothetical protein
MPIALEAELFSIGDAEKLCEDRLKSAFEAGASEESGGRAEPGNGQGQKVNFSQKGWKGRGLRV